MTTTARELSARIKMQERDPIVDDMIRDLRRSFDAAMRGDIIARATYTSLRATLSRSVEGRQALGEFKASLMPVDYEPQEEQKPSIARAAALALLRDYHDRAMGRNAHISVDGQGSPIFAYERLRRQILQQPDGPSIVDEFSRSVAERERE